ncbi:MAG: hypothetical protein V1725_00190 [archaeon]
MAFWEVILAVLAYIWHLILSWLNLFIAPILNLELMWIIIPIWFSWFFAEFFQEKSGTSYGNAISNGVVPVFVGLDWTRYLVKLITAGELMWGWELAIKFFICFIIFAYGLSVIIYGIKARAFVHYFGRIREITYILLMITPLMYGVAELHGEFFLVIFLFFPIWYFVIEWIDKKIPDPLAVRKDREDTESGQPSPSFSQPPPQTSFPDKNPFPPFPQ